jgi:hypothetical protein
LYECEVCKGVHLSSNTRHSDWVVKQLVLREGLK